MARGRSRKLDVVPEVAVEPAVQPAAPFISPEPTPELNAAGLPFAIPESPAEEELFDGLDDVPQATLTLFDAPAPPALQPPAPETIADADLEDEAKRELARLLSTGFPLVDRARLLVKLAHHTDTKRAPVALRAIQEINSLTGVTRERPVDTMPMFALPSDANVSIIVEKVIK